MEKSRELKRKILHLTLLCVFSLAAALLFQYFSALDKNQVINRQRDFEKVLRLKEEKLQKILVQVLDQTYNFSPFENIHRDLHADRWQEEGFSVFLYRNDSLIYWSDNSVPAENTYNDSLF
ncbi:MAG: hypothetical protein MUC31_04935, partial [Bacteroidales bacterium]|nr:hypothetical protein [Bacteroidales bacterium]